MKSKVMSSSHDTAGLCLLTTTEMDRPGPHCSVSCCSENYFLDALILLLTIKWEIISSFFQLIELTRFNIIVELVYTLHSINI